jgi:dTDP-4-dehydrorhamnose reductase
MSGRRWLVTGARGQLGSELLRVLDGQDVTALGRAELDVSDPAAVTGALHRWADAGRGPRVVLNAAAWTDVDGAESDPAGAEAANAAGPAALAGGCAATGSTLVHVSTDYVFPGTADRPYEVDDPTGPRTVYGSSKLAGERAVRDALAEHYVVRTGWVYGASGGNFVKTIARLRHRREHLDVVSDQVGGPTWAADLAAGLVALAGSGAAPGTYHCAGGGQASWFELARAVFEEVGADPERVRPCGTGQFPRPAPRPAYSVLSGRSWTTAGLPELPHWRDALRSAFQVNRSSLDTPYREVLDSDRG